VGDEQAAVALDVDILHVVEQTTTTTNEHQQPTAGVVVMLVCLQVIVEVQNTGCEDGNLHLCRTGVTFMGAVGRNNGCFVDTDAVAHNEPPLGMKVTREVATEATRGRSTRPVELSRGNARLEPQGSTTVQDMSFVSLVTIVVRDYDEAIAFYCDVLGFELTDDSASETNDGRPKRWVVVTPPGAQTGLLLAQADGETQQAAIGHQTAGRVAFFLRVDDFDTALTRLLSHNVTITSQPRPMPYGTVAVFEDICGNKWDLLGPTPQ
jgi:catechol 2,3-dioxygenase-like lactoylglutathione lyase family enzyme